MGNEFGCLEPLSLSEVSLALRAEHGGPTGPRAESRDTRDERHSETPLRGAAKKGRLRSSEDAAAAAPGPGAFLEVPCGPHRTRRTHGERGEQSSAAAAGGWWFLSVAESVHSRESVSVRLRGLRRGHAGLGSALPARSPAGVGRTCGEKREERERRGEEGRGKREEGERECVCFVEVVSRRWRQVWYRFRVPRLAQGQAGQALTGGGPPGPLSAQDDSDKVLILERGDCSAAYVYYSIVWLLLSDSPLEVFLPSTSTPRDPTRTEWKGG